MADKGTEGSGEESQGSRNYTSASFAQIQDDNTSLYPQSNPEMVEIISLILVCMPMSRWEKVIFLNLFL